MGGERGACSAWRPGPLGIAVASFFLLAGCGGENAFRTLGPADDGHPPTVEIQLPLTSDRVAVGDSVLVRVHLTDNQAIGSLELEGFSIHGSAELGTQTTVARFQAKIVSFTSPGREVRDTLISRYLLPTGEAVAEESVLLVATARDAAGNESADTVTVSIGGPRIAIVSPTGGVSAHAGSSLRIRAVASDSIHRVEAIRLRTSGTFEHDTLLLFQPPRLTVDTVVDLPIPGSAQAGEIQIRAFAWNVANDSTASVPLTVGLLPAAEDRTPPTVAFSVAVPQRVEHGDTVELSVAATDDAKVDRVGVTVLPIHRHAAGTDTLTTVSLSQPGDSATFRIPLAALGVPAPQDTSTLRLEVTAFAVDTAGNCAAATIPNTPLSEACAPGEPVFATRSGARSDVTLVRGSTVPTGSQGDWIVDIATDGEHLFFSNITRNRVEVLAVGESSFLEPISVGSRPWGLAFNRERTRLYVANSGGTNISVVSPVARVEIERIQTPNVKLFDVPYQAQTVPDPSEQSADSVSVLFPTSVTRYDYSDRPQFIGVTQNENLIFSTLPTPAAPDGTVRVYRTAQERLEIVTDYAEERVGNRMVIVNADSAFLVTVQPNNLLRVCPRPRSANPQLDGHLPPICFTGSIDFVGDSIASMGYDTHFRHSMAIGEVGLSDTTFVAVSGDHGTVAFGEGAREHGRVMAFADPAGQANAPLVRFGEIRDLVGNAAERVIGLGLNADGSLGIARGSDTFFFSPDLRLQGMVSTELGEGGIDMHPDNPAPHRAFVSGVEANGLAFIDVMDTFHFRRVARIFLRDPVTGPVRAVGLPGGGLQIYAVTARGIVALEVHDADL